MRRENRALAWALLASLLIHGALLVAPPAFWETIEHATRTPPPIVARLVERPPPAPAPPAPPPPAPSPPKKAAPKPRPVPPPLPAQRQRPVPEEVQQQKEEAVKTQAPAESLETKPAPPAPTPAPPAPTPAPPAAAPALPAPAPPVQAREPDIPSLVGQYGFVLKDEMRRQLKYPARARDEGWEGEGRLLLVVGEDGKIAQLSVVRSSGYALLDRTLVEGARRAQARVEIPPELRGRRFRLEIPFVMNLVDQ